VVENWTFDSCSRAKKDIIDKGKLLERPEGKARDLLIKRKCGCGAYLLVNSSFRIERMGFFFLKR